jgi:broad specificity phosphatase PhoE
MTIYLIRHGETELNVARVLQPADTPLSARGLAQARLLARRMSGCEVVGIISSHLPRALQTAREIELVCALPTQRSELLQERNFGDLRGLPYDELGFNPLLMSDAPAGGESAAQFSQRVAEAFRYIVGLRASMTGPLAVVTHGMVIRAMLLNQVNMAGGFEMPPHLGNTSVSAVEAEAPHRVTLLNCTRHLDAAHAHDGESLAGG